jgi:hypothetical protein
MEEWFGRRVVEYAGYPERIAVCVAQHPNNQCVYCKHPTWNECTACRALVCGKEWCEPLVCQGCKDPRLFCPAHLAAAGCGHGSFCEWCRLRWACDGCSKTACAACEDVGIVQNGLERRVLCFECRTRWEPPKPVSETWWERAAKLAARIEAYKALERGPACVYCGHGTILVCSAGKCRAKVCCGAWCTSKPCVQCSDYACPEHMTTTACGHAAVCVKCRDSLECEICEVYFCVDCEEIETYHVGRRRVRFCGKCAALRNLTRKRARE